MIIYPPVLTEENDSIKVSFKITQGDSDRTLWYSLPKEHKNMLSHSCDAALIALLVPAMEDGVDIHVEGEISGKLWHNLMLSYQHMMYHLMPWLKKVNLSANSFSSASNEGKAVIAGFSGGVDSFSVLHDYHYADIPAHLKLTHLLFNNVGSHGKGGEELFNARHKRLVPVAEKLGLPIIKVNSNVSEFYTSKKLPFNSTDTVRNASVALILQSGACKFMCASSYTYATLYVGKSKYMASCDALALPLLSTESLEAFAVGNEYTRVEKVAQAAQLHDSYSSLDVCVSGKHTGPPNNCSKCRKCNLTLVTLDILGAIESYSEVFDLDAYRKNKNAFLRKFLMERRCLSREIIEFGLKEGFKFPFFTLQCARVKHGFLNLFEKYPLPPRRGDGGLKVAPRS